MNHKNINMKLKNYIQFTGYILVFSGFITLVSGCKNAAEKSAEKMIEKSIKKSTGEDVDIDIKDQKTVIETEDGRMEVDALAKSWPDGIPSDIPEFKYGKISGVTSTTTDEGKMWTVVFSDINENATEKYNTDLKNKGFKTETVSMSGIGGTISAKKENMVVAAMIGDGEASISVQIGSEK